MKILRKLALACCVAALAAAPAIHLAAQTSDSSAQTTKKRVTPVDINSATSEELQTLKGIDSDAADKIIAGRTYKSITELVSKNILTKEAYNAIRNDIVAKKPADTSSSKKKNNNKNNNNRGKSGKGRR